MHDECGHGTTVDENFTASKTYDPSAQSPGKCSIDVAGDFELLFTNT